MMGEDTDVRSSARAAIPLWFRDYHAQPNADAIDVGRPQEATPR
jgi:hypothetical protein